MSAVATLPVSCPNPVFRAIPNVERHLPALVSGDYPLFGAKIGVRRLLLAERVSDAKRWFIEQQLAGAKRPLPYLWNVLLERQHEWFSSFWRVRLYEPSRELGAGDYIFEPTVNFTHVPGKPVENQCLADQIEASYMQAYLELRDKTFTYLDLVWHQQPNGALALLTPKGLKRELQAQQLEIFQFVNQWLWYYRTEKWMRARLEEILYATEIGLNITGAIVGAALWPLRLPLRLLLAERMRAQLRFTEGVWRTDIEVDTDASTLDLLASFFLSTSTIRESGLVKWDPVIVFEDPDYRPASFGGMPLGLIAHWE